MSAMLFRKTFILWITFTGFLTQASPDSFSKIGSFGDWNLYCDNDRSECAAVQKILDSESDHKTGVGITIRNASGSYNLVVTTFFPLYKSEPVSLLLDGIQFENLPVACDGSKCRAEVDLSQQDADRFIAAKELAVRVRLSASGGIDVPFEVAQLDAAIAKAKEIIASREPSK